MLIDTGPLVALLSRTDAYHEACSRQAAEIRATSYTCWPVITEAAYLLRHSLENVRRMLALVSGTEIEILALSEDDCPGILGILDKYADQQFDLADACLMHLAERERIDQVFTLDRRHFGAYRTEAGQPLELLPAYS